MNTQKHTPGPWVIQPSSNPKNGSAWRDIVSMGCEFTPSYVGEALEHDARLIAAAPDLLIALQKIDSCAAESVEWIRRVAREAIAKATGEVNE
jgi:hypothetical protein